MNEMVHSFPDYLRVCLEPIAGSQLVKELFITNKCVKIKFK